MQKFDTLIRDQNKKVSSEFPFGTRKPKKYSQLNDFPEVIEEDKKEEEKQPVYERKSRFAEMRDYNEFGGGKRYKSEEGLSKKKASRRHFRAAQITSKIFNLPSAYVSENEEESQSSEEGKQTNQTNTNSRKKPFVMSLGHLSKLINKKIFSDDFDKKSFATDVGTRYKKGRGLGSQSMVDQPIREEVKEYEFENDYLSDSSSSS